VERLRLNNPMLGPRQAGVARESAMPRRLDETADRILAHLVGRGAVEPVAARRAPKPFAGVPPPPRALTSKGLKADWSGALEMRVVFTDRLCLPLKRNGGPKSAAGPPHHVGRSKCHLSCVYRLEEFCNASGPPAV
jgi:hypothetical protein